MFTRTRSPHPHAAFAPEDVEDARRGHPDVDLRPYAERRALEHRGSALLTAFRGHLPRWTDYVHNAMTGVLPGGGFGVVQHELEEVGMVVGTGGGAHPDMNGVFHGVHGTASNADALFGIIPLPFKVNGKLADQPFADRSVWVPTTKAVVRVAEAALLPRLSVRRSDRFPPAGNPKLDDDGLPGFRLAGGKGIDPELRRAIFGGPAGAVLAGLPYPYVELVVHDGAVALQRNGYAREDADLDALCEAACAIADAVRAVALRDARPQRFDVRLEAPPELTLREIISARERRPMPEVADALRRAAGELDLVEEDPIALHRAFPEIPVPGVAQGVLRGRIPGSDAHGRLAWFVQGGPAIGTLRPAALFPARPDAQTPPGGVLIEETDMYAEVAGGIAACWMRVRTVGRLDSRPLCERALTTLRRLQLADV